MEYLSLFYISFFLLFQGLETKVKGKSFVPPLVLTSEEDKGKQNARPRDDIGDPGPVFSIVIHNF